MASFWALVSLAILAIVCSGQEAPSTFIVGGNSEARVNYVAYVVGKQEGNIDHGFLLSGTLISRTHVLTVAQAIVGFSQWMVGFGSPIYANMDFLTSETAIAHPDYNESVLTNNIGIIVLPLDPTTADIQFPSLNREPGEADMFFVYGFGTTNTGDMHDVPAQLQVALQTIVPLAECRNAFGNQIVNANTICTSSTISFVCHGDQGGPLMGLSSPVVFGITSFWMGPCDGRQTPTGSVRVSSFVDWIDATVEANP